MQRLYAGMLAIALSVAVPSFGSAGDCCVTSVVSVTWGRSCTYVPHSTEPLSYDGSLSVDGGSILYLDRLGYSRCRWTQHIESSERLYGDGAVSPIEQPLSWRSKVVPGAAFSLEGIRFAVKGDADSRVSLCLASGAIKFRMGELIEREHIRFRLGGKYSGVPVEVYLGQDARMRVSRRSFEESLDEKGEAGALLVPDDFADSAKARYHSMYCAVVGSNGECRVGFSLYNPTAKPVDGRCKIRLQLTAVMDYKGPCMQDAPISFSVSVGNVRRDFSYLFTTRMNLPKLEDIYMDVPWAELACDGNEFAIRKTSGDVQLLLHRVYVGAEVPTLRPRLAALPPLPAEKRFHVGTETDLLTPQNGDTDAFLDSMHDEQWGDFVVFRERSAQVTPEVSRRWSEKVAKYGFVATIDGGYGTGPVEMANLLASLKALPTGHFLGVHGHEQSNLAYGWGEPDPDREGRTLPECQQAYQRRMKKWDVVGQAVAVQHLDYGAGVKMVLSEVPASHVSLMLSAARGASKTYGGAPWGCHFANHVTRAPLDQDHVRRLFILSSLAWLNGAQVIYDEEVALRYNHDTVYAYSDSIPAQYRTIYQDIYHYGNAIELGREVVKTGFLQGNYDFVIGGLQASPTVKRSKFWGKFGPETAGWDFDTPEDGWKMLDTFMPGVWLYPVLQDPREIRLFYSGTPFGQVDLTPATADLKTLSSYSLLVLPGWNTMTEAIYGNLVEYVRRGGHLVLSAAQCSQRVTRDFLVRKRGFDFLRNGDLSDLCGVKIREDASLEKIRSVECLGKTFELSAGVPALDTTLFSARPLAKDQLGRPVLVENCIGEGRVWTLTVGDYWGNPALSAFNRHVCEKAAGDSLSYISVAGDVTDVDWHLYECGKFRRLVFLNTDWTSDGNVKHLKVKTPGLNFSTEVVEGHMRHVLLAESVAVGFDVPSAIVDGLSGDDGGVSFEVQGAGAVVLCVDSARKLSTLHVAGAHGARQGKRLHLDMGPTWTRARVRVDFEREGGGGL